MVFAELHLVQPYVKFQDVLAEGVHLQGLGPLLLRVRTLLLEKILLQARVLFVVLVGLLLVGLGLPADGRYFGLEGRGDRRDGVGVATEGVEGVE
jgi:hypothetical protein